MCVCVFLSFLVELVGHRPLGGEACKKVGRRETLRAWWVQQLCGAEVKAPAAQGIHRAPRLHDVLHPLPPAPLAL